MRGNVVQQRGRITAAVSLQEEGQDLGAHSVAMSTSLNFFTRTGFGKQRLTISIPEGSGGVEDSSEMQYPPEAVQIRNTFIHIASPAAPESACRAAVSCPASHVGLIQRTMKDWQDDVKPACGNPVICLEDALCVSTNEWAVEAVVDIPTGWQCAMQDWQLEPPAALAAPVELVPGTAQLPSIGSSGHYTGDCKPCSFLYAAQGCRNGAACIFCHLCDKSEKKRRQKLMRAALNKCQTA